MVFISQFTLYLIIFVVIAAVLLICEARKTKTKKLQPPTPAIKLPIIGHLYLMSGYKVPYQGFTELSKKFGDIFRLQMGYVKCVVVNGQKNIREALVTKGHHFDSRPNFERYQQLFGGNKENSIAFCNWSNTQKTRRDMLKVYTFPRAFTNKFYSLEEIISHGIQSLVTSIENKSILTKSTIAKVCANIFIRHFSSTNIDLNSDAFIEMVENYDEIFYEFNQGYAADFIPFLLPFHKSKINRINNLTHQIRDFVLNQIIKNRYENFDKNSDINDYVDSLINEVKFGNLPELTWNTALFALEDIIGGHSAVSNFMVKLFAYLAKEPEIQKNIQKEIDHVIGERPLTISDRTKLPYTEAAVFEAIRLIASPIVPRVANRDSSINDYYIEKGTVIFLNNYDLSMSENLWTAPEKFLPERFIKENRLVKPEHFLPFGGGRRSCMGYKMVQYVGFGILGGLLQKYTVCCNNMNYTVPVGSLALPKDTFSFNFVKR